MKECIELSALPMPRLQLTWEKLKKPRDGMNWFCHYELLMPLDKHDIRRGSRGKKEFLRLKLGGTHVGKSDGRTPEWDNGDIDKPFRDGAHIQWDARLLKLPMFVVYGNKAQRIEPLA